MFDVYIWEAHNNEPMWDFQNIDEPETLEERILNYELYKNKENMTLTALIDDPAEGSQDPGYWAHSSYDSSPTGLYLINLDGEFELLVYFALSNWKSDYNRFDTKIEELLEGIDAVPPEVEVTSPSGGEDLALGDDYDIKWEATDNSGEVVSRAIYLTTDGSKWELVDSSDDNTGTYTWTVPDESFNDCKVKVYAYDAIGNVGSDESDAFSIGGTGIIFNLPEASKMITISKTPESYTVYIPFSENYTVAITDVQGKQLTSFTTSGRGWYNLPVPGSLSSGMHILSIRTSERTIVKKFWFVR